MSPGFTFVPYDESSDQEWNLTDNIIQDSKGYLWVASQAGLMRYSSDHAETYFHNLDTTSISTNYIQAVFEDWSGNIWIGTRGNGVDLYDPVTNSFKRNFDPIRSDAIIWNFFQQDSSTLWISARHSLIKYDLVSNTCEYFDAPTPGKNFNVVRYVEADISDSTRLWCATLYGLYSFHIASGQWIPHPVPEAFFDGNGNSSFLLMHLFQSSDGDDIWASTWGNGMVRYRISDGSWSRFKIEPPHTDPNRWPNVIFKILPIDEYQLWVATSHGLGIFNTSNQTYQFYPEGKAPLLRPSFNYNGLCQTSDGRLVAGANGGFNISGPILSTSETSTSYSPEIVSISIDERPLDISTATTFLRSFELGENERDIAVEVTLPGVFNGQDISYRHRLDGYDSNWQTTSGNLIRYTNLRGGRYALNISASTDGETWREASHSVEITKRVSLSQNPLFYVALTAGIAAIFFIIYLLTVRSIRKRTKLKSDYDKKLAEIEMSALRAQMNPHFMFNSLNSIKAYIISQRTDEASQYLTKFSKLMRAVLRNSKSTLITLEDELSALNLYIELESLRFDGEFHYDIEVQSSISPEMVFIPPLLIQPYVENAIRHGFLEKEHGPKHLTLTIDETSDKGTVVHIRDNGVGRKATAKKTQFRSKADKSYGMAITGDRIALIEQTLGIKASVSITDLYEGTTPLGTLVEIRIPHISANSISS